MTDTPSEIAKLVHTRLMARSGSERFRMGVEMFEAARCMVLASMPAALSQAERKRWLYKRICGQAMPTR